MKLQFIPQHQEARRKTRQGFTLVELLTVITIIGILATIATVSFSSARIKARDARRLADMRALHDALELYYDEYGFYPTDNVPGENGIVLGETDALKLIDSGFAAHNSLVFMDPVPKNPGPFGADYVYESLNADGTPCDKAPCRSYRIGFSLESQTVGLAAGPYMQTPDGLMPATRRVAEIIIERTKVSGESQIVGGYYSFVAISAAARAKSVDNPAVERAAESVVAPVSTAISAVNTSVILFGALPSLAAAGPLAAMSQVTKFFWLLFTQPFMLLGKRRKYAWGVVYNSQTKLPEDLVLVRLIDDASGRIKRTRVTDETGRFFFLAEPGKYRLEVAKPGFEFPSKLLAGAAADEVYTNLYHGAHFTVSERRAAVNPVIPIDPALVLIPDRRIIMNVLRRQAQRAVALSGFFLTLASFAIKPDVFVGVLLGVHFVLFVVFSRLTIKKRIGEWGVVTDEAKNKPVSRAVVRLFSLPYHKLLESYVTDRRGRYHFLVGQNLFYLTVSHPQYWKTETFPLDLRNLKRPQAIVSPLKVRPLTKSPEPGPKMDISGPKL